MLSSLQPRPVSLLMNWFKIYQFWIKRIPYLAHLYIALKLGTYSSCNDSKRFENSKIILMSGKPPCGFISDFNLIARRE